jgi:thymidylate kinase
MASADPKRWRCVDATAPPDAVADAIWAAVAARLGLGP